MKLDPQLQRECDEAGIILWKRPLPPVRQPVRLADGTLVLDFASEPERRRFKQTCIHKVSSSCLDGARAACSLRAIDKCRGPGWLRWLGWESNKPWSELEACEEQYMQVCMETNANSCQQHAESFCEVVVAPKQ